MNKTEHQRFPDGTHVRFTAKAREAMQKRPGITKPLPTPSDGPDAAYTSDNTVDGLHDVVLRETGERYGTYWLEPVDDHEKGEEPMNTKIDIVENSVSRIPRPAALIANILFTVAAGLFIFVIALMPVMGLLGDCTLGAAAVNAILSKEPMSLSTCTPGEGEMQLIADVHRMLLGAAIASAIALGVIAIDHGAKTRRCKKNGSATS